MYVLPGEYQEPTRFQPPPDTRTWQERGQDQRGQFSELIASVFEQTRLVEASNNDAEALQQAYDNRFANILSATGVQLKRPMEIAMQERVARGESPRGVNEEELRAAEQVLFRQMQELQGRFPHSAAVIRADDPFEGDMRWVQQQADARLNAASANAKDLSMLHRGIAVLAGGVAASFRDPVNLAAAAVQPEVGAARTLFGRVMSRVVTEGAVNGGAEAVIQTLAEDGKRKAGLNTDGYWTQIGIAAAFGGGLGGLAEGAGHVLAKTGRVTPDTTAALDRMAKGEVADADLRTMADAMGVKLADDDLADLARARDVDADLAATLGPDVDPQLADDMARAMVDGSRPPGLRDDVVEFSDFRKTENAELSEDEIDLAYRQDAKDKMEKYIEVKERFDAAGGVMDAPSELFSEWMEASDALVEIFRITGVPGDSLGKFAIIDRPDDILDAFNRVSKKQRAEWLGGDAVPTKKKSIEGKITDLTSGVKLTEMLDNGSSVHLRDDPGFVGFVAEQNQLRLQKLEQAIAMSEADIAHLRDDGSLDALPSERDFSGMRASDDVDRAHRVVQELESKVTKAKAEIASGKAFNTDDVALQKRFADERGARTIVHADVKAQGLGEVNSVKAGDVAKARLAAASPAAPDAAAAPAPKAKAAPRDTLDILDALPAGTDIDGNPIVTTHAELTDFATRLDDLADVIAACRAT